MGTLGVPLPRRPEADSTSELMNPSVRIDMPPENLRRSLMGNDFRSAAVLTLGKNDC